MKKFIKVNEFVNNNFIPVYINIDKIIEVFYCEETNRIVISMENGITKQIRPTSENLNSLREIDIDNISF